MSNLLELTGPDGEETFTLKINGELDINVELSMVLDTLVNQADQRTASDIKLERRTYTINGKIGGMDETDYPDHISTPDGVNHNHAYAYNLENVANDWGIGKGGRATLKWPRGGINQEIKGTIKSLTLTVIPDKENNPDHYTYTMEFSAIDFKFE